LADYDYGSQFQLRRWIGTAADELNVRILRSLDMLRDWPVQKIEWISPLSADKYEELGDKAWGEIGLPGPSPLEAGWWPKRGPEWDAVARVIGPDGQVGALVIEAKGRGREIRGPGCHAEGASRELIKSALDDVKNDLDVGPQADWLGSYYQTANRLAYLWFARIRSKPSVPVWLLFVYFLGERYGDVVRGEQGPKTEEDWRPLIEATKDELELPPDLHLLGPWMGEVFLEALMEESRESRS
jgi:hypothetical protein